MATTLTAAALRRELSIRALQYAGLHPHESTTGPTPGIVFQPCADAHGNFHPASWRAILANPAWLARLAKAYTATRRIPHRHHPDRNRPRHELDCAASSDALLMNIFCHPQTLRRTATQALLGLAGNETPIFGYHPRLPLPPGRRNKPLADRTEIDLHLGPLLIEAKLTESDFQRAPLSALERYPAFSSLFDLESLPLVAPASPPPDPLADFPDAPPRATPKPRPPTLHSYQLIRGVLAAHHEDKRFVVLCDHRRADLIERWFLILRAIRSAHLRSRCALLTWQELAATLPAPLQQFLAEKYGILPA